MTSNSSSTPRTQVYVVTSVYSGYKEELNHKDFATFVFLNYQKAQEAMRKIAKEMYEGDPIIQEADDKYFDESDNYIYFGENEECGTNYRAAWGLVMIDKSFLE